MIGENAVFCVPVSHTPSEEHLMVNKIYSKKLLLWKHLRCLLERDISRKSDLLRFKHFLNMY